MPQQRELTEDELNHLESRGIDSSAYRGKKVTIATDNELAQPAVKPQDNTPSTAGAIASSLKQHGLSTAAGGLAGSAVMAALAPETGGLSLLPLLGTIAAGTVTGMGVSAATQKAQEAIEGDETANKLNAEAQAGEEAHPWATSLADVALGSLAGGFRPSLSGGIKNAAKNAALQTGVGAATDLVTGQPITGRGMLLNAIGGAAFNKPFGPIGALHGGEPTPEPIKGDTNIEKPPAEVGEQQGPQNRQSPWTLQDAEGNYHLDNKSVGNEYKRQNPAPQRADYGEDYTQYQLDRKKYNDMDISERRQALHQDWLGKTYTGEQQGPTPPQEQVVQPPTAQIDENHGGGEMENFSNKLGEAIDTTSNGYSPEEITQLQQKKQSVAEAVKNWQQEQMINGPASQHPDVLEAQKKAQVAAQRLDEFNKALVEKYKQEAAEHAAQQPANDSQPADLSKGLEIGNNLNSPETVTRTGLERQSLKKELAAKALADRIEQEQQSQEQDRAEKIRTSPSNEPWSDSDKQLHADLQTKMRALMQSGDIHSPELVKLFKEFEDVRNKHGGMPPTAKVSDVPSTTGDYLRTVKDGNGEDLAKTLGNANKNYKGLMDYLVQSGALKKVRVTSNDEESHYQSIGDSINIHPRKVNSHDVIAEELLHAATAKQIGLAFRDPELKGTYKFAVDNRGQTYINKIMSLAKNSKNVGIKNLADAFLQYHRVNRHIDEAGNTTMPFGQPGEVAKIKGWAGGRIGHEQGYYSGDLKEFVAAAFHNKGMRAELEAIQDKTPNTNQSLWGKFKDAIKSLFGMDAKNGTLLEKVLDSGKNLIDETGKAKGEGKEIKGEEGKVGTKPEEEKPTKGWISTIDNIRTQVSKPIADAFQKVLFKNDQNVGSTWNKIKSTMDKVGFTKADGQQLDRVAKYENQNNAPAPSTMFRNAAQREVYKVERQVHTESGLRNIQDKVPVYRDGKPTLLKQNPYSHPTPINPDVAKVLRDNSDKGKIAQLHKEFVNSASKDYGVTPPVAEKMFSSLVEHMQGKSASGSTTTPLFAGSRMPEGIPLPESWQKGSYSQRLETYYRRNAMDNAFYKHVESNPEVWGKLGNSTDAWGNKVPKSTKGSYQNNPYVKTQLSEFSAAHSAKSGSPLEKGWMSLAAQMFIANPGIELHKIGSNEIGALSYISNGKQLSGFLQGSVKALSSGLEHAKENGLIKMTSRSVSDVLDKQSTILDRMRGVAKLFNTVGTLGGLTERVSTGLLQAGIEGILPDKIERANKGDANEQQLLKRIDPSYTTGKTYNTKEISQLASSLAGFIHGTHDGRTMPKWMQSENEISGFAQLAHWSVAQTGRFMNDIVEPAKSGNYKPLVISLLGSALGGAVIKEMREKLQGKDGPIPSLNEIANSGGSQGRKAGLLAYNLTSAAQYAGFAGLFSTAVKDSMDLIYKNHPQGFTFPLDEIATSLAENISQFTSAAVNDPDFNWGKAGVELTKNVLTQNIQLARMGMNQAINHDLITGPQAEKKKLSDKMGELRKFEMTQGLPYQEQEPSTANPYMDIEEKSFRNEPNPYKAAGQLPGILQSIVEENQNNPDVIRSKFKGLKSMQYSSMPSPERMPMEFVRYVDFLKRTRGEEYANEAVKDFITHEAINKAKSSLVPSL